MTMSKPLGLIGTGNASASSSHSSLSSRTRPKDAPEGGAEEEKKKDIGPEDETNNPITPAAPSHTQLRKTTSKAKKRGRMIIKSSSNSKNRKIPIAKIQGDASSFEFHSQQKQTQRCPSSSDYCYVDSSLQPTQYDTILYRRKRRNVNPSEEENSTYPEQEQKEEEEDVSLGMKLTILEGLVIVQNLIELKDGRASPAQLTGKIKRGDVLVRIEGVSLVNMGFDNLAKALEPLSNFESFPVLRLRFEMGGGFPILEKTENPSNKSKATVPPPSDDMFLFSQFLPKDFSLVDQHSGMPFVDDIQEELLKMDPVIQQIEEKKEEDNELSLNPDKNENSPDSGVVETPQPTIAASSFFDSYTTPDKIQAIAETLTQSHSREKRIKYNTLYYDLNPTHSTLLRSSFYSQQEQPDSDNNLNVISSSLEDFIRQKRERIDLSNRVILGAKTYCEFWDQREKEQIRNNIVSIGSSANSIVSGGTTLSIRKKNGLSSHNSPWKSSQPNKMIMTGVPSLIEEGDGEQDSDEEGFQNDNNTSFVPEDEEVWKDQLLHMLQVALKEHQEEESQTTRVPKVGINALSLTAPPQQGIISNASSEEEEDQIKSQLESFLLGGTQNQKLLTRRTKALPSIQPTSSLYDIVSKLEDEEGFVSTFGSVKSGRSRVKRMQENSMLYLVKDAMPLWFLLFVPLQIEHRRMIFPPDDGHMIGGADNDDMSIMSDSRSVGSVSVQSGWPFTSPSAKQPTALEWEKRQVETQTLDAETRVMTSFLVSFYFIRKFTKQQQQQQPSGVAFTNDPAKDIPACDFIRQHGAYIHLYNALVAAGNSHSNAMIRELLNVAEYDPKHQEAMKDLERITKSNKKKFFLVLYEPSLLSALLTYLQHPINTKNIDYYAKLLPLFVSAYPELKPWQVREMSSDGDCKELYYYYDYLSLLLDPIEGDDLARKEPYLVNEWCTLSTSSRLTDIPNRTSNFYTVASSEDKGFYYRDLPMLLNSCMTIPDFDLALNLVNEIIMYSKYNQNPRILSTIINNLRLIGKTAIRQQQQKNEGNNTNMLEMTSLLKRVLLCFNNMANSGSKHVRQSINIPDLLLYLLDICRDCTDMTITISPLSSTIAATQLQQDFVLLLSEIIIPQDALMALVKWNNNNSGNLIVLPNEVLSYCLQKLLKRGALFNFEKELSGTLLKLNWARRQGTNNDNIGVRADGRVDFVIGNTSQADDENATERMPSPAGCGRDMIWNRLLAGKASIQK